MGAEECPGRLVHAIEVQGSIPRQHLPTRERRRTVGVITHPVRIPAPDRTETRIEARGGWLDVQNADIRGKCTVDASTVDVGMIDGDVEVDHLAAGVDAGISATGAGCLHLGAVEMRENPLEFTLDRAQGPLLCPAGEIRAVVRDRGAQTTQPATIGGGL